MYRLLQIHEAGSKGNLIFNELADAEKWLFWAGLQIVCKQVDLTTGKIEVTAIGRHDKEYRFRIAPILDADERDAA